MAVFVRYLKVVMRDCLGTFILSRIYIFLGERCKQSSPKFISTMLKILWVGCKQKGGISTMKFRFRLWHAKRHPGCSDGMYASTDSHEDCTLSSKGTFLRKKSLSCQCHFHSMLRMNTRRVKHRHGDIFLFHQQRDFSASQYNSLRPSLHEVTNDADVCGP